MLEDLPGLEPALEPCDGGMAITSLAEEQKAFEASLETATRLDDALAWVFEDATRIPEMIEALAGLWALIKINDLWEGGGDPKLQRTSEILHIMSATIHYSTRYLLDTYTSQSDRQSAARVFEATYE